MKTISPFPVHGEVRWLKRFAWLPVSIENEVVWLKSYREAQVYQRAHGDHRNYTDGWWVSADKEDIQRISDGFHTFEELYDHRCLIWINLCLNNPQNAYWRPHYEGWPLLGLETDGAQMTYHVKEKYLPLFKDVLKQGGPAWDLHTSADVLQRLKNLAGLQRRALKNVVEAK